MGVAVTPMDPAAPLPIAVRLSGVGAGVPVGGGPPVAMPLAGGGAGVHVQIPQHAAPIVVAIAATLERAPVDFYFGPAAGAPQNVAAPTLLALLEDGEPSECLRLVLREPGA